MENKIIINNLKLDAFSKYEIFQSTELNNCFYELSKQLFYSNAPYLGGYLDRDYQTHLSLFVGNMSRDAMITLYDDCEFTCNEDTPRLISFAGSTRKQILSNLNKYQIKKTQQTDRGIYYFNHQTLVETKIEFKRNFEIVLSRGIILEDKQAKTYSLNPKNSLEKIIEIVRDFRF